MSFCPTQIPPPYPARSTVDSLSSVVAYHLPGFFASSAHSGVCGVPANLVVRNYHAAAGPRGSTVIVGSALYVQTATVEGYLAVFSAAGALLYCVPLFSGSEHLTQPAHVAVYHNIAFIVGQNSANVPTVARMDLRTYAPNPAGSLVQFDAGDLIVATEFEGGLFASICSGGVGEGHCECEDCENVLPPTIWVVATGMNGDVQQALLVSFDSTSLAQGPSVFSDSSRASQGVDGAFMSNGHIAVAYNTPGEGEPSVGALWCVNPARITHSTTTPFSGGDQSCRTFPICVRVVPQTGTILVLGFFVSLENVGPNEGPGPVLFAFSPDGTTPTITPSFYVGEIEGGFLIPTDLYITPDGTTAILFGNATAFVALDQSDPRSGSEGSGPPILNTALTSCPATPWWTGFIALEYFAPVQWAMTVPTAVFSTSSSSAYGWGDVSGFSILPPPSFTAYPGVRWGTAVVGSGVSLRMVGDFTTVEAMLDIPAQPASVVIIPVDLSVLFYGGQFIPPPTLPARPAIDVDPFTGVVTIDCAPLSTLLAVHGGTDISGDAAIAGSLDVGGSAHIHGSETVNGCLNVHERVHIGGCLDVCGSADVRGAVTAHGLVTADDGLVVHGGATVHGLLTADCGAEVVGHLCVTQAMTIGPAGDITPVPGTIQYSGGYYWGWIQTGTESSHDSSPGRIIYNWVRFVMDY